MPLASIPRRLKPGSCFKAHAARVNLCPSRTLFLPRLCSFGKVAAPNRRPIGAEAEVKLKKARAHAAA